MSVELGKREEEVCRPEVMKSNLWPGSEEQLLRVMGMRFSRKSPVVEDTVRQRFEEDWGCISCAFGVVRCLGWLW